MTKLYRTINKENNFKKKHSPVRGHSGRTSARPAERRRGRGVAAAAAGAQIPTACPVVGRVDGGSACELYE